MKKKFCILAVIMIMIFILTGCEGTFIEIFEPMILSKSIDNVKISETNVEEELLYTKDFNLIENVEKISNNSDTFIITDIDSFVEYIEKNVNSEVSVFNYEKNYFNDFLYEQVDESAEIAIKEGDFYPLYMSVFFRDLKPFNVVLTYNKLDTDDGKYLGFIKSLFTQLGKNVNMTENNIENMTSDLVNFNKYSDNVYGNPEYSCFFENVNSLGVIFPEGKDFIFDGVTYYFSFYFNDYFVENESV